MAYQTKSPIGFLFNQPSKLDIPQTDLTGRTVIVTGANSGIGLSTAHLLASYLPTLLILAVRNLKTGEEAATAISKANPDVKVEVWRLDMADFGSVKEFAGMVGALNRLDVFVANAGISPYKYSKTVDGLESTIQVNTIATTLLSLLVLPIMQHTVTLPLLPDQPSFKPHLTIVTSFVHYQDAGLPGLEEGRVLEYANEEKRFVKMGETYNHSKTILQLIIPLIAEKAGPGIYVTGVDPGYVKTNVMRDATGVTKVLIGALASITSRTPEQGAKTVAWASVADLPDSGLYSSNCQITVPSEFLQSDKDDHSKAKIVWAEMEAIWMDKAGVTVP